MTWDKLSEKERDKLVDYEVMEKQYCKQHEDCKFLIDHITLRPPYTTDICAAWQVVEKLRSKYLEFYMNTLGSDLWECEVEIGEADNFIVVNAKSQNPCEAICCCALRAEGVEI